MGSWHEIRPASTQFSKVDRVPGGAALRVRVGKGWTRDLVIVRHETLERPVPGPTGEPEFTRWVEQPELAFVPDGANADEGLVLARLTGTRDGAIDVDTSVRRAFRPAGST